ncbi:flagellar L-ring protein [Iodidimonas nitroreducens]|uniref:Flagellar L-ring protein n=1 Tax=Iodidimonas nitroreducens TaxID=1236968 RepID=A0A5A7N5N0_9PROT|nr:flagellar basal body L-ring protein FlgH [Iodidimonas nitroreducens]GAK32348.1 flagellar L-ring protein [alpha proteobacterium Q-1]GER03307.1 flagellar L-ring protein [Iodidimonas nitroreducens]
MAMLKSVFKSAAFKAILLASLGTSLSACSGRLGRIGEDPQMTPVEDPQQRREDQVVSYPLPAMGDQTLPPNALWTAGKKTFFRDLRAQSIGDLLTVVIDIDDEAELTNSTRQNRTANSDLGLDGFFGLPGELDDALPNSFDPSAAIDLNSNSQHNGEGEIDREEEISLRVAAIVIQELPNGNFVISGRQELRVNSELREVRIAGIIRPEDVATDNTIRYDQIAEARFQYGGRGVLSDIQRPRYGQEFLDIILPF